MEVIFGITTHFWSIILEEHEIGNVSLLAFVIDTE